MMFIQPSEAYMDEIWSYRQEFMDVNGSMDGCGTLSRSASPQAWLSTAQALKSADTAPEGMVPATQLMYVRPEDGRIVGMLDIRHYFNDYLRQYGGNIGYSVRPSERRKGYATQMLAAALPLCRNLGLSKVLITCKQSNQGSRKTILNNGGVYESTVTLPDGGEPLERYWIDLTDLRGGQST